MLAFSGMCVKGPLGDAEVRGSFNEGQVVEVKRVFGSELGYERERGVYSRFVIRLLSLSRYAQRTSGV